MADHNIARPCNIVLHDDRVSTHDALAGADVLEVGALAYLSTKDVARVLILASGRAQGHRDISLHVSLAARLGFANRTHGKLQYIRDEVTTVADHVDIFLRDQVLSRADLWHLTRQLDKQVLYADSTINYLQSKAAIIQSIYQRGDVVGSAAYRDGQTKAIIRSGNARFVILIQISTELLEDWIDGELAYEHLLTSFLPKLFSKWDALKARHLVSVILFGRASRKGNTASDFYFTVSNNTPCRYWHEIVLSLKRAFNGSELPQQVSLAGRGNLLEAINLTAASLYAEPTYLFGTGSTIIAVTAGSGLFEADYSLLCATTRVLLGNSIGVDLVSLAAKPPHPVPLFSYTLNDRQEYALPHWADISYLKTQDKGSLHGNHLRCEVDYVSDHVTLPVMRQGHLRKIQDLDRFDVNVFSSPITSTRAPVGGSSRPAIADGNAIDPEHTLLVKAKLRPPKLKQHPSTSSIATTISLNKAAKSNVTSLLSNRKISMGPRGLAPITGLANATVSVTHASQDRDMPLSPRFVPRENESDLAKQIRATLRRRPSQSSMLSRTTDLDDFPTQAIAIEQATVFQPGYKAPISEIDVNNNEHRQSLSSTAKSLKSTSNTLRAFDNLASSPQKLSLDPSIASLTPWLTLLNPCNLRKDNMRIAEQYRQWQHIFPKTIDSADVKWSSLCTPAILPLVQNLCPAADDLKRYYGRSTRRLVCAQPDGSGMRPHELMQRLVALRLAHGFQMIATPHVSSQPTVLMSIGANYHELKCLSEAELEVVEYKYHLSAAAYSRQAPKPCSIEVKTYYNNRSIIQPIAFTDEFAPADWALLDQQMLSAETNVTPSRIRIVLLPAELGKASEVGSSTKDLADDEKRIEGIQRLTQQLQRHRVLSSKDQSHQVSIARKRQSRNEDQADPNPLAIEYHTRDPSTLVNAQESNLSEKGNGMVHQPPLFAESDMFHSSNFDITKLVRQMHEPPPHGVDMRDRRWFTRVHLKCFRGDEMTNWLLGAFKDIQSREEAVEMGNELMQRDVFVHVRHKHAFLDGNYFYQIAPTHRAAEQTNALASVFGRASNRSVPPTPSLDVKMSPKVRPARGDSESSGTDPAHVLPADRKQVMLSQMLKYNVDPTGKSEYPETISVHYDRIHNPENCYHLYLDWCLTTPLLVRESITRWTNLVEPYGLNLVQIPMLEACKYSAVHPFEQPCYIKLALEPPDKVPSTPMLSNTGGSPRLVEDRSYYYKAICRKLGFVLDLEAADTFSNKLDVQVTWGKMDFTMSQFVHRSGLVLAQFARHQQWDLLLLPNSLYSDRSHGFTGRDQVADTVCSIFQNVRKFAKNANALRALYDEAAKPRAAAAPSPFAKAALANLDTDVPPMQLPPHLLSRVFS